VEQTVGDLVRKAGQVEKTLDRTILASRGVSHPVLTVHLFRRVEGD
jgi:hypothetical protein